MSKVDTLHTTVRLTLPLEFPAWWWRAALFIVLISIYAFLSSSTPEEFGLPEAVMGLLLLGFVGARGAMLSMGGFLAKRQKGVPSVAYWSFLALALVPSVWGVLVLGNQLSDYIRDVIPLLYLFLPIFFVPQMINHREAWQRLCIAALCVIGIAYSVRHFMSDAVGVAGLGQEIIFGDKNYFPMDPAVLFAATFLLASGLVKLTDGKWMQGTLRLMLGTVAFASLVGVLVRAQIFLVLFSLLAVLVCHLLRYPRSFILWVIPLGAGLIFVVASADTNYLDTLFGLIAAKSEHAGFLNSRDLEAQAVINNAMSGIGQLLLGEGWGGLIDNPAGGGVVRFTHNFELYALLKGGLIGLILIALYSFLHVRNLARQGWRSWAQRDFQRLPLLLAIGNVLCVNLLLEGGYKIFSFGLVLTVLWLFHSGSPSGRH